MSFPQDLTCFIVNDSASYGRAALLIPLFCQKKGDAHEVPIREFLEESGTYNLLKTPGREMSDRVQNLIRDGGILGDQSFHTSSFRNPECVQRFAIRNSILQK